MSAAAPKIRRRAVVPNWLRDFNKKHWSKDTPLGLREHPGRKIGATPSSWVDDMAALHKAIVLCWACAPKFNHKAYHYYKDRKFTTGVNGRCDGCRQHRMNQSFYIHESNLCEPDGRTVSGQSWTPV